MPTFEIAVFREWTERGTMTVTADTADDAKELAEESLNGGDEGIEWNSSNMEPGNQGVDNVTGVPESCSVCGRTGKHRDDCVLKGLVGEPEEKCIE